MKSDETCSFIRSCRKLVGSMGHGGAMAEWKLHSMPKKPTRRRIVCPTRSEDVSLPKLEPRSERSEPSPLCTEPSPVRDTVRGRAVEKARSSPTAAAPLTVTVRHVRQKSRDFLIVLWMYVDVFYCVFAFRGWHVCLVTLLADLLYVERLDPASEILLETLPLFAVFANVCHCLPLFASSIRAMYFSNDGTQADTGSQSLESYNS